MSEHVTGAHAGTDGDHASAGMHKTQIGLVQGAAVLLSSGTPPSNPNVERYLLIGRNNAPDVRIYGGLAFTMANCR